MAKTLLVCVLSVHYSLFQERAKGLDRFSLNQRHFLLDQPDIQVLTTD